MNYFKCDICHIMWQDDLEEISCNCPFRYCKYMGRYFRVNDWTQEIRYADEISKDQYINIKNLNSCFKLEAI